MANGIKSPDEVLLYCASMVMKIGYRAFWISPLSLQFWPPFCAVIIAALALVHMSATIDVYYLPVAAFCLMWIRMYWRDHATLRVDSRREWTASLFKQYGGKAALLRANTAWVRYLMLSIAIIMTLISFSDLSEEINRLSTWQRCVFPLNIWALVALAYSQSAEPPIPNAGDFFGETGRV